MDRDILEYAGGARVCVIALEMPDGTPHAATVHFAHTEDPFALVFMTSRAYRKSEALLGKERVRASVVIGSNEGDMRTFQLDGVAGVIEAESPAAEAYFLKFPEKREKYEKGTELLFSFVPTWWRFTDWTGAAGKAVRTGP